MPRSDRFEVQGHTPDITHWGGKRLTNKSLPLSMYSGEEESSAKPLEETAEVAQGRDKGHSTAIGNRPPTPREQVKQHVHSELAREESKNFFSRHDKVALQEFGLYSSSESSSSAFSNHSRNFSALLRTLRLVARSTYFLLALLPQPLSTSSLTMSF